MANFQAVQIAYKLFEPEVGANPNLCPIIYLHGLSASKEYWADTAQKTANASRRIAYTLDARNHGDSEWSDVFNFDINADDVIHFMDSKGISKAILIGHSMGGITAIKAALRWPGRIEKIVVEDMIVRKLPKEMLTPVHVYLSAARKVFEALPANLEEKDAKMFIFKNISEQLPAELTKMTEQEPSQIEDKLDFIQLYRGTDGRFRPKMNFDVIERAVMDVESISSEPRGVYEGPALFIYGKLSFFSVGEEEENIKTFFPNAVLEGVEGAGHDIHFQFPEKFFQSVIAMLT